jgi:sulfopyruvate decarboxylase TPP-binding subunit
VAHGEVLLDAQRLDGGITRRSSLPCESFHGEKSNFHPLDVFTGQQIASLLLELGVTHVVSIADSTIGAWAEEIDRTPGISLVRVCREGEAWAVAGGLQLGGAIPLVLIQCTGLFESGDALRNVLHDWKIPVFSIIGYRSYLDQSTIPGDTCLVFTEPVLDAWKLDYRFVKQPSEFDLIRQHFIDCRARSVPGVILLAEGKA